MFRPFTSQNPAGAKSSNGVLLGFSELFRKFYAAEVYSEVVKMFRRVYTPTYGGRKLFIGSFSSWPCALKFPLKMSLPTKKQKLDRRKLQKNVGLWI